MRQRLITFVLFLNLIPLFAQEWVRQHPFEDLRDVLDVAMSPGGFGVMVGEDGLAMETQDFGETWAYIGDNFIGTQREAACVPNGDGTYTTWIAGNDLWRSADGGQSWEKLPDPEGVGNTFFMHVLQPDELFVANYVTLLKTADGGGNWTDITPENVGFISNIFFLDSNHGWVGNRDGQLFITQDGGQTWAQVMVAEGLEEYVEPLFVDELNGYASLREDFYRTSDGGFTWEKIADNAFGNYTDDMMFMDEAGQSIVATSFDTGIYQSTDGGQTWSRTLTGSINNGLYALPDGRAWIGSNYRSVYYSPEPGGAYQNLVPGLRVSLQEIAFWDIDHGWAVGGSSVLKTTDGGDNWEALSLQGFSTENSLQQILVISEQEVWLSGRRYVVRTTDGGATWEELFEIPEGNLEYGLEKVGNSVMVVAREGAIYRTEDNGATWAELTVDGVERLRSFDFPDEQTGYAVGGQSTLIKTTDGGASWAEVPADLPDGLNILEVSFTSPDTGWIVNRDLSDHLWKTVDGGLTWASSSVSQNIRWAGVDFVNDTLGYLYGGTSIVGRVYQTTDAGDSWSSLYDISLELTDVHFAANESVSRLWVAGVAGNIERLETELLTNAPESYPAQHLNVAPNPTTGSLFLQLPAQLSIDARIEIYNAAGQLVSQQTATPQLSTAGWAPGLYLLRLTDGRQHYQAKVIKAQP
ncbi:YCF48-related protein [Phaeodactylibacter xiamenensis]|uniref:YCF48-related protein n=1 Tax=Phaeodactylibacter xiamenensis TaxID=1524460 RepID=UPI003CCBBB3F